MCCFNPRPAFQPGEAMSVPVRSLPLALFQSTPGFSAGRSLHLHVAEELAELVSIHARLFSRAKPTRAPLQHRGVHVSIHARLFSRAKLYSINSLTKLQFFQTRRESKKFI